MKTLNRLILVVTLLILTYSSTISQTPGVEVGSFETSIIFNGEPSNVAYYVPLDYDSLTSYKLIVGLHYCIGATGYYSYRNLLMDISDSLNAIIMCPDCHNGNYPYYLPDESIIPKSIDSTKSIYNIDEDFIYLTGGSCNGRSTLKYGLENIYNFRGIIAFNPFIPSVPNGYYNYDSEMPTCICSGTLDPSYNNAVKVYDSLVNHQANVKLISMEGVGHDFWIPEFNIEMMNGIHYIDSVANIITVNASYMKIPYELKVYPNPYNYRTYIEVLSTNIDEIIELKLCDIFGNPIKEIYRGKLSNSKKTIELTHYRKGLFLLKLISNNNVVYKKLISN